ncbi:P-loop containing nucleoside triphosphate hydrolase [Vibrio phage 1.161.O._10N.261.48.C5]|nr:P-loop containing nucleoside triphosphate hydrolase [Vibrio phage 1.161.O._10N.261.48.C5]
MFVTISSYSKGKAKSSARKILNKYLPYIGNDTWQGNIGQQGLSQIRTLLNRSCTKNTSIVCKYKHYNSNDMLWCVGTNKLNCDGQHPVATTKNVHKVSPNNYLQLKLGLVGVAALFHDLGKAGHYFQQKLRGKVPVSDPIRHEWISAVILSNWAKEDWLGGLVVGELPNLNTQHKESVYTNDQVLNSVLWLMYTHHKKAMITDELVLTGNGIEHVFKNTLCMQGWHNRSEDIEQCYNVCDSFINDEYRFLVKRYATKLKQNLHLFYTLTPDQQIHILQECRVALMLGDSSFSSELVYGKGKLYANLDQDGKLKQTLTQHLVGVTRSAVNAMYQMNTLQASTAAHYPALSDQSFGNFTWQNAIAKIPKDLDNMFCINLSSTGKGKTVANLKILNRFGDIRCSTALGMVTLTEQTARQYSEVVGVDNNDMGVVVGFNPYKVNVGSESLEDDHVDLKYTGNVQTKFSTLFPNNNAGYKKGKVLNAPILVSTVDHLVNASGVVKGNKQMLPFIRCMQSDLILDEIDDYGIDDIKVLARLVKLTASYGNKVIISSATITPSISKLLYTAYQQGWEVYKQFNIKAKGDVNVVWIDEFGVKVNEVLPQNFDNHNSRFLHKRIGKLLQQNPKHKFNVATDPCNFSAIKSAVIDLSKQHSTTVNGNSISFGLIRTTTIKDCIAVTKYLQEADLDVNVKLICYHSRFLQQTRANIEHYLHKVLCRKNDEWQDHVDTSKDTVYIVVATPVIEVGRDLDFDWAIIEPASERSIVQTCGRVLRHRDITPSTNNIVILQTPFKFMRNPRLCYDTAGYESKGYKLKSKNMLDIYKNIGIVNSINRLTGNTAFYSKSLVNLEHKVLSEKLTCNVAYNSALCGGWLLSATPHHFCKWRSGSSTVLTCENGNWQSNVEWQKDDGDKIWRKFASFSGQISIPTYNVGKTISYSHFYGGVEMEK